MSILLFILSTKIFLHSYLLHASFKRTVVEPVHYKDINLESRKNKSESLLLDHLKENQTKEIKNVAAENQTKQMSEKKINAAKSPSSSTLPRENKSSNNSNYLNFNQSHQNSGEINLTTLSTYQPVDVVSPKTYIMVDPRKIEASSLLLDKNLDTKIYTYIDTLKNDPQYKNLAENVPELFVTYTIESINKKSYFNFAQGTFWSFLYPDKPYTPDRLKNEQYSKWVNPSSSYDGDPYLANLYQGMQFLKKYDFTQNYNKVVDSNNQWMVADMDVYVDALRTLYIHVPDIILKSYITAYLKNPENQKYIENVVPGTSPLAIILGKKSVVQTSTPIPITPEMLLHETKGQQIEKGIFSGLKISNMEENFDSKRLEDHQKLYLTMEAIENINRNYPEEYQTVMIDGLYIQDKKSFEMRRTEALKRQRAPEYFIFSFDITKSDYNSTRPFNIETLARSLQNNYPSYEEFTSNKKDLQAFEQLQIDFITLNQDILVAQKEFARMSDAQNSLKSKLRSLINVANQFKDSMDQVIVNQQFENFMETSTPSENNDILIDDSFIFLEKLIAPEGGNNPSEIQKILNQQKLKINNKINPILIVAHEKLATIDTKDLQLDKLPDLIEQKTQNDLAKEQRNFELSKTIESRQNYYVQKIVVDQLKVLLHRLTLDHNRIVLKAAPIVNRILLTDTSIQARDNIMQESLKELKAKILNQKTSASQMISKVLDELIKEYEDKDFVSQDIGKITQTLEGLIERYNNNEDLKIYNQVFIELHKALRQDQIQKQKKIQFDTQVQEYINNGLSNNSSLAAMIKKIDKKITDLEMQLKERNDLLPTEVSDLNRGLKNNAGEISENLVNFSTFEIGQRKDIIKIYRDILQELKNRQQQQRENSSGYQFRKNLYDGLQNIFNKNFNQGSSHVGDAVSHIPGAVGEVNTALTNYVDSILGSIKNNLGAVTLAGIATVISAVAPILIQINQTNASDDEKKKMQQEALAAMMGDIGNLVIADQTGASIDVVAGRDAQTIAMSSVFNKAINLLVPDNPNAGFSYNNAVTSPSYVSNVSKFQTQYNSVLQNQYPAQPNNRYVSNPGPSLYGSNYNVFSY